MKPLTLAPHDVLVVVGVRGSGKSHAVKHRVVKHAPRVVVWDPHDEYAVTCGLRRVTLSAFLDAVDLEAEALRLAVVPTWSRRTALDSQFGEFVDFVATGEGFTLVVDEVGALGGEGQQALVFSACQSRHWRVPLVMVAQRAVQIPKTAREQMSHLWSFRQTDPADVRALAERIGPRADRIPAMPRHECVEWHEDDVFQPSVSTQCFNPVRQRRSRE